MSEKPETRQKRVERYAYKKSLYDRHLAGETYVQIAADLNVPLHNVMRHVGDWRETMDRYPRYLQRRHLYPERRIIQLDRYFQTLAEAGLLEVPRIPKQSPEYGYA